MSNPALAAERVLRTPQTKSDIVNFFGIDEKKIEVVYQGCHPDFQKEVDTNTKLKAIEAWNAATPEADKLI